MTNLAKSTKTLFRRLYKGNAFTQSEISAMLWKVNHPREKAPAYNSYWHGALEQHVEAGRVQKTVTKTRGTTYRITSEGREFARNYDLV